MRKMIIGTALAAGAVTAAFLSVEPSWKAPGLQKAAGINSAIDRTIALRSALHWEGVDIAQGLGLIQTDHAEPQETLHGNIHKITPKGYLVVSYFTEQGKQKARARLADVEIVNLEAAKEVMSKMQDQDAVFDLYGNGAVAVRLGSNGTLNERLVSAGAASTKTRPGTGQWEKLQAAEAWEKVM